MKVLILYESRFGNGKKLCEQLKELFISKGHDAETFSVIDTGPGKLPEADLYVFSAPTRMFMLAPAMKSFLKNFKPSKEGSKYALMTTYLNPQVKALANMEKLLKPKNMVKVTNGFTVKVLGTEGPMEDGYEKRLEEFAEELLKA
jgi:flavodoxin